MEDEVLYSQLLFLWENINKKYKYFCIKKQLKYTEKSLESNAYFEVLFQKYVV